MGLQFVPIEYTQQVGFYAQNIVLLQIPNEYRKVFEGSESTDLRIHHLW